MVYSKKVKLYRHVMQATKGREYLLLVLDLGRRWGEWSRHGRALSPEESTPGTHWTGGWVGLRAGLDTEAREKVLWLY
jgi:hypothetical protein